MPLFSVVQQFRAGGSPDGDDLLSSLSVRALSTEPRHGDGTIAIQPWVLFTDFAFLSVLLLIGQLARNYIPLLQKYMLPASLTAGFLGLAFGPNGLGYIPYRTSWGPIPPS